MSAATVGKVKESVTFLKIARMKVPAADTEYAKKINDNLKMLDTEDKKSMDNERY